VNPRVEACAPFPAHAAARLHVADGDTTLSSGRPSGDDYLPVCVLESARRKPIRARVTKETCDRMGIRVVTEAAGASALARQKA
jgi:hypothetical protein